MRERIIAEIQRLAAADGQPPGRMKFEKETGIRYSDWYGVYWARWGDAVAEAGLSPNSVQAKADRDTLLEKIAEAYRSVGHVATEGELRLYGRRHADFPGHSTIFNHFGGKAGLLAALREWVARTPEFADVAAMLPEEERPAPAPRGTKPKDGSVYLIQYGPHFKIGRGNELEKRVKQVQIALPEAGTLVHAITTDDPPGIEAYWHRRFADKRLNGEWFKLTPADVLAFKRRKFQ